MLWNVVYHKLICLWLCLLVFILIYVIIYCETLNSYLRVYSVQMYIRISILKQHLSWRFKRRGMNQFVSSFISIFLVLLTCPLHFFEWNRTHWIVVTVDWQSTYLQLTVLIVLFARIIQRERHYIFTAASVFQVASTVTHRIVSRHTVYRV